MRDAWHVAGRRPRVAVHKFSSCDGCQLAFLNAGADLLRLADQVELVHFLEAGLDAPDATVDLAFVEGSISTPEDLERIRTIRERSALLVAIGACAIAGGLQALRNRADAPAWLAGVYPRPEWLSVLETSTPVSAHVPVDWDVPGCPVSTAQVTAVVRALALGVAPRPVDQKQCLDCKHRGLTCVVVARGEACLGPVTAAGCGALCPGQGRGCYGCYGPAEAPNTAALGRRLRADGLAPEQIARRFTHINNNAPAFAEAADALLDKLDKKDSP